MMRHSPLAEGSIGSGSIVGPEFGYDWAAKFYDDWHWQKIWQAVEWPFVLDTIRALQHRHRPCAILDVGCGTGTLLSRIAEVSAGDLELYGVDLSRGMLSIARKKMSLASVHLQHVDFLNNCFDPEIFDALFICRVASHIQDISSLLAKAAGLLKKSGYLIFSDVHERHPYTYTSLPIDADKRINILTFKHSTDDVLRVAQSHSLYVERSKILFPKELPSSLQDPTLVPRSLDFENNVPFGFILVLRSRTETAY
jgi:ubiquinone/menaquinone biosynthesis C-methylase UbiE